ncbi:hypothetical protein BC833DRAFT_599159 [Globomyces pollinis-pini]|nr:hypothetical protein BC833DRAFT_599159 [Globomyces pollinis-pini]
MIVLDSMKSIFKFLSNFWTEMENQTKTEFEFNGEIYPIGTCVFLKQPRNYHHKYIIKVLHILHEENVIYLSGVQLIQLNNTLELIYSHNEVSFNPYHIIGICKVLSIWDFNTLQPSLQSNTYYCSKAYNLDKSKLLNFDWDLQIVSEPKEFNPRLLNGESKNHNNSDQDDYKLENDIDSNEYISDYKRDLKHDLKVPKSIPSKSYSKIQKLICISSLLQHSMNSKYFVGRTNQVCSIEKFLWNHLDKQVGGALYVSGENGSGKTMTVKYVITILKDIVNEQFLTPFEFIEISGLDFSDPYCSLYEKLNPGKKVTRSQAETLLDVRFTTLSTYRLPLILMVDDLESMCLKTKSLFSKFVNWSKNFNSKLILVFIGCEENLPTKEEYLSIRQNQYIEKIHFESYTFNDWIQIINHRLNGSNIFEPQAIEFCCRKSRSESNDIQLCLNILRLALKQVAHSHEVETKTVTMNEVVKAFKAYGNGSIELDINERKLVSPQKTTKIKTPTKMKTPIKFATSSKFRHQLKRSSTLIPSSPTRNQDSKIVSDNCKDILLNLLSYRRNGQVIIEDILTTKLDGKCDRLDFQKIMKNVTLYKYSSMEQFAKDLNDYLDVYATHPSCANSVVLLKNVFGLYMKELDNSSLLITNPGKLDAHHSDQDLNQLAESIFKAIEQNQYELFTELFNTKMINQLYPANVNLFQIQFNWSFLHCASYFGKKKIIMFLMRHGFDIHLKDTWLERTALAWTVVGQHPNTCRLLIENYDADINIVDLLNRKPADLIPPKQHSRWCHIFIKPSHILTTPIKKKRKISRHFTSYSTDTNLNGSAGISTNLFFSPPTTPKSSLF